MATDNTTLNTGTGGDAIRDIDKGGIKTQVVILDLGGAGAESLLTGTLPVSLATAPLPATAATDTLQTAGNASLTSIDGKITACNTGAVVISSGTITSITNSVTVTGSVTVSATDLDIRNLVFATDKVDISGSSGVGVTGTFWPATQPISGTIDAITASVAVTGAFFQATQPVSLAQPVSATATEDVPTYTEGATQALSQDLEGNLRTRLSAVVSDVPPNYLTGSTEPLSLSSDGRLRVSFVPSDNYIDFFTPFNFGNPENIWNTEQLGSPW